MKLLSFSVALMLVIASSGVPLAAQGLKDLFQGDFHIGVALNASQVAGREEGVMLEVKKHFSSLSPENGLKWALIHPQDGIFNFEFGDQYVRLGKQLNAFLVGHTLIWHQQTPKWVFLDGQNQLLDKVNLIMRIENHIETVVGRYKGKIHGWDVVNEVFEDDGSHRQSPWYTSTGTDYIKTAFRKANEIDPDAELYYNDYNVWKPKKLEAILRMANQLRSEGLRIDGIGMQGHYRLGTPDLKQVENAIVEIHKAGFKVMITELDIDVLPRPDNATGADLNLDYAASSAWNPYAMGLPDQIEAQLVARYSSLFALFKKHRDKIARVTFWGLHDGKSWLNNWPIRGRTNYPLIFDRQMNLKKGFAEAFQTDL